MWDLVEQTVGTGAASVLALLVVCLGVLARLAWLVRRG